MRGLGLAVGIGDLPRLDGVEGIAAVGIGAAAASPSSDRPVTGAADAPSNFQEDKEGSYMSRTRCHILLTR